MKRPVRNTTLISLASAEVQLHEIEQLQKQLRQRLAAVAETLRIAHEELTAHSKTAARKRSRAR